MRVCGWNLPNRHSLFYFLFLLFFAYSWLFSFFSILEAFEQQLAISWRGVFSVSSYTQYFNVDTDLVLNRLLGSLHPIGGDFFTKIDPNPDLWVLIFITGHLLLILYFTFGLQFGEYYWIYVFLSVINR